ncbi:MAG TPA: SPOR domain-containing protein [Propylenella sp.]|nr:SPOR domain-containing protein [Propylenella sp.]
MAESDPRKIRPLAQPADRTSFDAEEDPLVELARIVSEDSGFYGGSSQKPAPRHDQTIDRNAFSADLETELLQELESSFSPRSPSAAQRMSPQPAEEPTSDNADDLLRSIEAQLGEFERRAQAGGGAPDEKQKPAAPSRSSSSSLVEPENRDQPATAVQDPGSPGNSATRISGPEAISEPVPSREESDLPPKPLPTRFATRVGRATEAAGTTIAGSHGRPRDSSTESEGHRRPAASQPADNRQYSTSEVGPRLQSPAPLSVAESLDRSGPPVAAGREPEVRGETRTASGSLEAALQPRVSPGPVTNVETGLTRELEPSYSDPTFGGHWQDATADSSTDEPGFTVSDVAPVPVSRRAYPSRGLTVIAGVLTVIVVAAGLAAYFRSGGAAPSGPPPVIVAQEGAVKVEAPAPPVTESDTVGEAVYNRVAGDTPPANEQVVDSAEEPREISRIVLPPAGSEADVGLVREVGEASGDPASADRSTSLPAAAAAVDQSSAAATTAPQSVGPRRVRTYVVRPDGTIVAAGEAPATLPSPVEEELAMPAAPIDPVRVQTTSVDESGRPQDQSEAEPAPVVVAESEMSAGPEPSENTAPPPEMDAQPPAAEEVAAVEPAETETTASADGEPAASVGVASESAAPAADAQTPIVDGHFVQLSSQRDEAQAQASFSAMQSRYSDILEGMEPNIQRADLGAKGIYYRARVGPFPTRPDAIEVCEKLKAAGGTCIVTR